MGLVGLVQVSQKRRKASLKGKVALVIVVIVVTTISILKPLFNPDMVGYIAVAEASTSYEQTYQRTLADLGKLPKANYEDLLTLYQYNSPEHLALQLPNFSVKVLYVGAVRVLDLMGIEMALATVLVSIFGYSLAAFILWRWVGAWAIPIILCPPLIALVRQSTPDSLCTAILISGIYALSRGRTDFGCALLVAAIWTRPDAIIFSGLLLFGLWLLRRLSLKWFAAFSLVSIGSYFFINKLAGGYNWSDLSYTLIDHAHISTQQTVHMNPYSYVLLLGKGLLPLENAAAIFLLVGFIALVAWWILPDRFYRMLILTSLAGIAIHFILYPVLLVRFMAPMLLTIEVAMAVAANQITSARAARPATFGVWPQEQPASPRTS